MTNRFDPNDVILVGSDDGETPNGKYISSTNPLYVQPIDFFAAIGLGLVPGWSSFRLQGILPPATSTSWQTLWGGGAGFYVWANTSETIEILSDSSNDNSTGTGARSVQITYLDINLDQKIVTVNLLGLTPVQLATDFYRMVRCQVVDSGSGNENEGTLTVRRTSDSTVRTKILPGNGINFDAIYTVPSGLQTAPDNAFTNVKKDFDVDFRYRLRLPGTATWITVNEFNIYQSGDTFRNTAYGFLPPGSDIEVQVLPNATGATMTLLLEGINKEV